MRYRTAGRSTIETLNKAARRYERNGDSASDAVRSAAHDAGLTLVRESEQAGLYRSRRNTYVNAWWGEGDNVLQRVADGGAGFDDNVEMWIE